MNSSDEDNEKQANESYDSPARKSYSGASDIESITDETASSLNEVLALKHDLLAKLEAAKQTRIQYKEREYELEKQINELNEKAGITLKYLDERKDQLSIENEELLEINDSLPDSDFINSQYTALQKISTSAPKSQEDYFLDLKPLRELGILTEDESYALLPKRLKELTQQLSELTYRSPTRPHRTNDLIPIDDTDAGVLMHKIKLLETTYESTMRASNENIMYLEAEIQEKRKELEELKRSMGIRTPRTMTRSNTGSISPFNSPMSASSRSNKAPYQ